MTEERARQVREKEEGDEEDAPFAVGGEDGVGHGEEEEEAEAEGEERARERERAEEEEENEAGADAPSRDSVEYTAFLSIG